MTTYLSPAKINLFFIILSKRGDGYHEIASLYQTVNLFDKISLSPSERDSFSSSEESLCNPSNLIIKALNIFRRELFSLEQNTKNKDGNKTIKNNKNPFFVKIHLEKNIPIGGGLGGGSSNAATTLWALNELLQKPFSVEELIDMAKKLGADVPFFFSSGSAFCTGIGEIVEDVNFEEDIGYYCGSWSNQEIFIVKPSFEMFTKDVYSNVKLDQLEKFSSQQLNSSLFSKESKFAKESDFLLKRVMYVNQLEKSAFDLNPKLAEIKEELLGLGFNKVFMTGSGSCFVCIGNKNIKKTIKKKEKGAVDFDHNIECSSKETLFFNESSSTNINKYFKILFIQKNLSKWYSG